VSDPPTIAVRPWRLLAIVLTSVACASLYALNVDSPVRTAAALGFILLAPGLALLAVLRIDEPMLQLAVAPSISLAAATLVAITFISLSWFSPGRVFVCLWVLTAVATVVAVSRDVRARRPLPEWSGWSTG
jgi:hypothetical protein